MKGLVWFRRDLRLHDNSALSAACKECQEIVPLFVFDEPLLRSQVFGSACVGFMLGSLEELRRSLDEQGLLLAWRIGEPIETVIQMATDVEVDAVYWNRDYEPASLERDRTVQQRLTQQGRTVRTFKDHVVFEAEEVRGLTGDPFQRYSAYGTAGGPSGGPHRPPLLAVPHLRRRSWSISFRLPPWPTESDLGYEPVPCGSNPVSRRRVPDYNGSCEDRSMTMSAAGIFRRSTAPLSCLPICASGRFPPGPQFMQLWTVCQKAVACRARMFSRGWMSLSGGSFFSKS